MSGSKWSKMFFRNTLVAHKSLINPYFSGVVVQQALIDWINADKRLKTSGTPCFWGFSFWKMCYNCSSKI